MEVFKNLRLKIGNGILSRKIDKTKRKVYYSSFSQVKSIGIVWDASKPSEFVNLSRFHQRMNELNVDVRIFGFFPGKNLPDQYTAIRYLSCIRKDEINVFYQPLSPEAEKFINNPFDILIDVNFNKLFPLNYVTALSKARFKIGLSDGDNINSPFNLILELKNPVDIDQYLNQSIHYLEMIKDKTIKPVEK
jgi:hypothetical protein